MRVQRQGGAGARGRDDGGNSRLALPGQFRVQKTMTPEDIRKKRAEFWDTQVSGNRDAWNYLKMSAEALLGGDADTANAILEAASIRTPSGSLALCYDERGNEYRVPDYCFSNPSTSGSVAPPKPKPTGPAKPIELRMRVPSHITDFQVKITDADTVGDLKKALYEAMAARDGVEPLDIGRMRCIFSGRNLDDALVIREVNGLDDKGVVQIFPRPAPK